jgi:hypothetical protein
VLLVVTVNVIIITNVVVLGLQVLLYVTHLLSDDPVNKLGKRNILRKGWSAKGIGSSEDESEVKYSGAVGDEIQVKHCSQP